MFVKRKIILAAGLVSLTLLACGGGGGHHGGGNSAPPVGNADPGGIWKGADAITPSLTLYGVVTETGEFRGIRSDGAQYVGTVVTSANSISGNFVGYAPTGTTFPDGSTQGSGTLSGTIVAGQSISGSVSFTTANNSTTSGSVALTFKNLYNTGSSLSAIAGNYSGPDGSTISVNAGVVTSQDPVTGCVINGSVAIINPSYDVYSVSYSFDNCVGSAAYLNGTTATGLGVLDTTANPVQAVIGVSNAGAGYILTEQLPRQ